MTDGLPESVFEMAVARTRWLLLLEARSIVRALRHSDDPVTRELLMHHLGLAILHARPRSKLIAWHLPSDVVDEIVRRVAAEVVADGR